MGFHDGHCQFHYPGAENHSYFLQKVKTRHQQQKNEPDFSRNIRNHHHLTPKQPPSLQHWFHIKTKVGLNYIPVSFRVVEGDFQVQKTIPSPAGLFLPSASSLVTCYMFPPPALHACNERLHHLFASNTCQPTLLFSWGNLHLPISLGTSCRSRVGSFDGLPTYPVHLYFYHVNDPIPNPFSNHTSIGGLVFIPFPKSPSECSVLLSGLSRSEGCPSCFADYWWAPNLVTFRAHLA